MCVCDIIFSMPWNCGESDCPAGWHLANYWCDTGSDTGYTVDHYSDGDHEDIEESKLPSQEEQDAAWKEYYQHVLDTGTDPLGEFMVKRSQKVKEVWHFRFGFSILGYVCVQAKHARKVYRPAEFPEHVRRYLNLANTPAPVMQDFADAEGCKRFEEMGFRTGVWTRQELDCDKPRSERRVAAELKRAARKALARKS